MDDWESHFREKSARRARGHSRDKLIRRSVLTLLLTSIAAGAYLMVVGMPQ